MDLGIENIERISTLQVLLNSEQVTYGMANAVRRLERPKRGFRFFIREYEKEIISFTPWVKQLQKIPTTLLNEKQTVYEYTKKMSELLEN